MFMFVWILLLVHFQQGKPGYIETVRVSGCESCRLMLTCRHLTSVIAILEADFVPDEIQGNNSIIPTAFPLVHPRQALNKRCSGVNHCSFIFTEDTPDANIWGSGNITIKYVCITEDKIQKYCNTEIILPAKNARGISEGFIHNPGYPRFYPGQRECRWLIKAPPQQRIQINILDISIVVDNVPTPEDCTDILEVKDTDNVIYSTCRQEEPPVQLISGSDTMEIVLTSFQAINPRRGILIHYTAVGCPTPKIPEDGYLVYRNDTVADFSCCVGFFFPDTGLRRKSVRCLGAIWDTTLPLLDCQKIATPPPKQVKILPKKISMASELIAPGIIIFLLFLINGAVLFYIHRIKKKHADEYRDEELATFTNPNR